MSPTQGTPTASARLELLGPARLLDGQGEVILRPGLPLALLAYMHQAPAPVLRGHLAELFWPGRARPLALQSLRQALSRLRGVLGDGALEIEGRLVSVARGSIQSDLADLRVALASGDAEAAAGLWRGAFLAESRFPNNWELEDWLERERARHGETLRGFLLAAVHERIEGGDAQAAFPLLATLRARLPSDDAVLLAHFDALLHSGRPEEAAGVLEELRVLEGDEAGLAPYRARLAAVMAQARTVPRASGDRSPAPASTTVARPAPRVGGPPKPAGGPPRPAGGPEVPAGGPRVPAGSPPPPRRPGTTDSRAADPTAFRGADAQAGPGAIPGAIPGAVSGAMAGATNGGKAPGNPDPPRPPRRITLRVKPLHLRGALLLLGGAVLALSGAAFAFTTRPSPPEAPVPADGWVDERLAGRVDASAAPRGDSDLLFCTSTATHGQADQLFRMDLHGWNKHRIVDLPGCEAAWVPGADALLFLASPVFPGPPGGVEGEIGNPPSTPDPSSGAPRLHRLDPLPGNPQAEWRVTPLESTRGLQGIHWPYRQVEGSPGGGRALVVATEAGGTPSVYLVDLVADRLVRLTDDAGSEDHPAWDAHRGLVLFSSDRGGPRELWALDLDAPGSTPRRLLESPSQDTRPVPHPRGILFVRGEGEGPTEGDMAIHLLEDDPEAPGGFRPRVLVDEPWNDLNPGWSPDGRYLCWQSEEFGHFESHIKVMELDTGATWTATRDLPGRSSTCSITLDGGHLLFTQVVERGVEQVYLLPLAGGDAENLSRTTGPAFPFVELPPGLLPALKEGARVQP